MSARYPRPWLPRILTRASVTGWVAWCFVLSLCAAQWLGTVHQTLHLKAGQGGSAAMSVAAGHAAHADSLGAHGLARLFAHSDNGGTDCRLYDQSSHGDQILALALPALPTLAAPLLAGSLPALVFAWRCAPPRSRGPPAFR